MFRLHRQVARIVELGGIGTLLLCVATTAHAQGDVVMGFDALMAINTDEGGGTMGSNPSWGGFGRFSYDGIAITTSSELGRYGAIEIQHIGGDGSGMGFNFTAGDPNNPINAGVTINPVSSDLFPLLDRSGFGVNFDPSQYVAELVYKPLADNTGDQLNVTLDTFDGFNASGERIAEQWQWNFFGLASPTGTPDADGFYTVRNADSDMDGESTLAGTDAGFNGPSYMFEIAPLPGMGDGEADFDEFEGDFLPVPNGARQIHLQTPYYDPVQPELVEHFAIKSLRIVKIDPDQQEVARLDGHSGFSNRFGSPFRRGAEDPPINIGGTDYIPSEFNTFANTDQVSRFDENGFTNIILKSHDDGEVGGLALYQPSASQVFNGTDATVDVTAKLTVAQGPGQADRIVLVLKDKDGNDDAAGQGGDEYHYDLLLNQYDTSTMTTISVPLSSFTRLTAGEFVNDGDGLLSDFNLYYLGLETVADIGLVNMEIESIRVMLPAPAGLPGDYNANGIVDAADYVMWRKNEGQNVTLSNERADATTPGVVDAEDYEFWVANFGNTSGSGSVLGETRAIPEPTGCVLVLSFIAASAGIRRF